MLERIDEAGTVTKLDYDPAGRIESRSILVTDENGEVHETDKENYAYDPSGRLAGTQNAYSRHQYFYDKLGNLIREYRHDSLDGTARSHVWHHRYDALGNRTETIRPDGQRIGYLHYGSGHLHGITLNRNEIAAFERDKLHRETERTFGKHIRQETQYDPMGRILQQIHNRSRREYGYDAAGQLTHIQSKGGQTQYRYDPIGRLIAAVTPDFSETFAFDPAGNRLNLSGNKQDRTGQTSSQEKPSLNKVWGNLLKEYSGVHYDYDQRGNLIRKTRNGETTDYHWNGYNQLVKIENLNGSTEYRYDPLGRRTAKIRNGETTVYHWQEDTLAIESTNGQNTHYLFEPSTFEPLAQFQTASPIGIEREDKPAEPYSYDPETDPLLKIPPEPQEQSEAQPELVYYQLDHLGTPIAAHNAKGEAVWTAEYEAWGRIRNETVSDGLKANIPFRFQGQYYDEESGLHYNRFRYYAPEIGRFVSQDPIGLRGGTNLFEYAPNPILWVDPLGLSSFSCNKLTVCGCKEILKSENVIIGKHGDMKKIGGLKDSHHIYQDAAVRNIPNYKYNHAIAISIQGRNPDGSTKNTPHYRANRAQDNSSKAGILGAETVVAYNSLRAAGLSAKAAKCATLEARKYLIGLGANAGSSTNQLSRRRK